MGDPSVELAELLRTGQVTFAQLDQCQSQLPLNPNPICVPFSQMLLFAEETSPSVLQAKGYLVRPAFLARDSRPDPSAQADLAADVARSLASHLPVNRAIARGELPRPDGAGAIAAKEAALVERGVVAKNHQLSQAELRRAYAAFVTDSRVRQVAAINQRFGMRLSAADLLEPGLKNATTKTHTRLFPGFFQPFSATPPKVAVVARYQQCWTPAGYTRGELVNAFSLAPGEQLTLEYHYWDKSTVRSEEELASETDLRVTNTLTQRSSQELLSELFSEAGTKVDGGANVTIPIPAGAVPIPLGVDFSGGFSSRVGSSLKSAATSSSDQVIEASNSFKQTHRVRVEITRETGRETKQTRVIANTNRCHTLNCQYFEVLANYVISVRLTSLDPCLLVPFDSPRIDDAFVLSHEHILRRVLLDRVFLEGFAAAKRLRAHRVFLTLQRERRLASVRAAPATGSPSGSPAHQRFLRLQTKVLDAFRSVKADAENVLAPLGQVSSLGDIVGLFADTVTRLRRLVYWAMLNLNPDAVPALEALAETSASSADPQEALTDFCAVASSRDYETNVVQATIKKGLEGLGIPRPVVDLLLLANVLNLVDLVGEDAGLAAAVRSAEVAVSKAPLPVVPAATPSAGTAPDQPGPGGDLDLADQAVDTVELDRLLAHLRENSAHYRQAIFQSMHPDQRLERLRERGLEGLVRNDIAGFFNEHALFPLAEAQSFVDLLKAGTSMRVSVGDVETFGRAIAAEIAGGDRPRLVTIPTPATVMEARLGECDACEDYIQKSRLADLRQQDAKASLDEARSRQETAEAARRDLRLSAQPPDLADPVDRGSAKIVLDLTTNQPQGGSPP